jgi:hypothetical protein
MRYGRDDTLGLQSASGVSVMGQFAVPQALKRI